ncbi:hypothetical protein C9J01_02445 [Photobacterium rosenbergii]|uniref:HTH arsR-type domain-containing protein n=2 Tax=Photobacterium rosenbergii TaxID=294936 RepID=A0A2T3NK89_9GAMM|nr:hypothetical protein C9J01_02445 [Photobacterium rosenbergii]
MYVHAYIKVHHMKKIMTDLQSKERLFENSMESQLFKVFSEPARIQLAQIMISLGTSDVSTIAKHVSQDRSVVSRHLKAMHEVGVVSSEKVGRHTLYTFRAEDLASRLEFIAANIRAIETKKDSSS